jgi:hypothetical protein
MSPAGWQCVRKAARACYEYKGGTNCGKAYLWVYFDPDAERRPQLQIDWAYFPYSND